jgi:site-specific DNA recombinase
MLTAGYIRISGEEQSVSPRILEEQQVRIRTYAQDNELVLVNIYADTGINGSVRSTRAGLMALLDDSNNGTFSTVLITSRDRIAREEELGCKVLRELAENGKRVIAVDEGELVGWPDRVPGGPRRAKDFRPVAERLLRGREEGARLGRHQSGTAPYGYRRDYSAKGQGVPLVIHPQEAQVVKLIFREYLRLRSMKKLIDLLNGMGIKTRRGKEWSRAGISWILKNKTYLGKVHFGQIRSKGLHEAIISPIIYNKVQKLIRKNNKRGANKAKRQPAHR